MRSPSRLRAIPALCALGLSVAASCAEVISIPEREQPADVAACDGDDCTCKANHGNCDGNLVNGCETDLTSSSDCGACGHDCLGPGLSGGKDPTCSSSTCGSTSLGPELNALGPALFAGKLFFVDLDTGDIFSRDALGSKPFTRVFTGPGTDVVGDLAVGADALFVEIAEDNSELTPRRVIVIDDAFNVSEPFLQAKLGEVNDGSLSMAVIGKTLVFGEGDTVSTFDTSSEELVKVADLAVGTRVRGLANKAYWTPDIQKIFSLSEGDSKPSVEFEGTTKFSICFQVPTEVGFLTRDCAGNSVVNLIPPSGDPIQLPGYLIDGTSVAGGLYYLDDWKKQLRYWRPNGEDGTLVNFTQKGFDVGPDFRVVADETAVYWQSNAGFDRMAR